MASVTDYVLAAQDEPRIEHFTRQKDRTWLMREIGTGQSLRLEGIRVDVALDEVYAGVFDED
jgi:Uma2 family endonuclease